MSTLSLDEVSIMVLAAVVLFATGFFQAAGEDLWETIKQRFRRK